MAVTAFRLGIAATTAVLLSTTACSTTGFSRADGANKYRSLPAGTDVKVADSTEGLGKHELLGSIAVTVKPDDPEGQRDRIELGFKKTAAKRGCDLIAAISMKEIEAEVTKREKVEGEAGQVKYKKVVVPTTRYQWSALCIRTANAPGGLKGGGPTAPRAVATSDEAQPTPDQPLPTPPPPPPGNGTTQPGATPAPPPPVRLPPPPPSPAAQPTLKKGPKLSPQAQKLWERLGAYKTTYLSSQKEALSRPVKTSLDAVVALALVMSDVTGEGGFWRKTLPQQFGCTTSPESKACKTLDNAVRSLGKWDTLLEQIGQLSEDTASAWLADNFDDVKLYLDTYVPAEPTLTAAQKTTFFKQYFAL